MKKSARIKLIIVAIIVALIILMSIIIQIRSGISSENKTTEQNVVSTETEPSTLYTDTSIKKVETMSLLLATQDAINKYYEYLSSNNYVALMGILDNEFITNNNITTNNVLGSLKNSNSKLSFFCIDEYSKEISFDHEYRFWIYGKSYSNDFSEIAENQFIVNLDMYNLTFKITPMGQTTKQSYDSYIDSLIHTDNGKKTTIDDTVTSITVNNYNKFEIYEGNQGIKNIIENYAKYYYFLEMTDSSSAYNLLNTEYKNKKYGNYSEYQKSKLLWKNIDIQYVKQTVEKDKTLYIGIDKSGTYYIFLEKSPMEYEIMLDSYTIPLTETVDKYTSSGSVEKVCMCLENIKEMLNLRDYKTLYEYMNTTFKQNNYSTIDSFQRYVDSKYYSNNNFEYESYNVSGDSYIVKVKVSNASDTNSYFEINYVVKLNTNLNDFEYSFEI